MRYKLFKYMLREEWRFHSNLFGSIRFAVFPLQITLLVSMLAWFVSFTQIDPQQILLGMHGIVLLFGLQTGVVSFEGVDAIENVIGEVTYLIFSTRTLPVSQKQLLITYLLKDIVYYSIIFVLPITIGMLPLYSASSISYSYITLLSLFISLSTIFICGSGLAILSIGSFKGSQSTALLPIVGVFLIGGGLYAGVDVLSFTPYAIYTPTSVVDVVRGSVPVVGIAVLAVYSYSPSNYANRTEVSGSYRMFKQYIPGAYSALVSKTLVDTHRSNGGLLSVCLVAGVLFGLVVFLIWGVQNLVDIVLNKSIIHSVLLSLTAYTTYEQITQYDDLEEYTYTPISVRQVFLSKYIVFLLFMLPITILFYGGGVLYYQPTILNSFVGGVVFIALSTYMYGVTIFNNGFGSGEFMFDTVSFGLFAIAFFIAVLPLLFASLVVNLPLLGVGSILVWCLILSIVGIYLIWASPMYWKEKYLAN